MANSFAKPVVVCIDDAACAVFTEIAGRTGVPSERIGGQLVKRALLACVPGDSGQQELACRTGKQYSLPTAPMGGARGWQGWRH